MSQSENPFQAPQTEGAVAVELVGEDVDAESVRRMYIKHEQAVRSVSLLYYVAAFFTGVGGVGMLIVMGTVAAEGGPEADGFLVVISAVNVGLSVLCVLGGNWLRRLDRRARPLVGVLSGIGLIHIPIGTLINGYILYLLFSKKGKVVFSPEYKEIIRQTPFIRPGMSGLIIAVLCVLIVLLGLVVVSIVFI